MAEYRRREFPASTRVEAWQRDQRARDEPVAFLALLGKRLPKALEHSGTIGTEMTREQMIERLAALHARAAKPADQ